MPATRPKILFVSARLPYPAVEGHQIRTLGVLSELAKDYDIYLLSLLRKHESVDHSNKLGKLCKHIVGVDSSRSLLSLGGAVVQGLLSDTPLVVNKYVSPELKRRFVELADSCQPDIIHLDLLHLASLAELSPRSTPIVLNEHNIESHLTSQRLLNERNLIKRVLYRRENRTLQEFEKNACLRSNLVLACSAEDQQTIEGFGSKEVVQIPNGVNIQELRPAQATSNSKRLVFLGGMAWYPNRLGLQWFVDEVMPLLKEHDPDICLDAIGNPEPALTIPAGLASNVNVLGFVDDFRPIVHAAAIMVVPLHLGSGTRLKVVEGMAMGKCIISTTKGAEGIRVKGNTDLIFANTATEFARSITETLNNPEQRAEIELNARQQAEKLYSWDKIGQTLRASYRQLL